MKLSSFVGSLFVTVTCALPLLVSGCGSDFKGEDGTPVEKTGTLAAALQATGDDGATYRFVPGSMMHLNSAVSYPIDGAETVFTRTLAPGNYGIVLSFGGYVEPHLLRIAPDGSETTVKAVWTNTQPLVAVITASSTTNVTLTFEVPGFGNVSFSPGTLNVDLDVENTVASIPSSAGFFADAIVSNAYFADPTAAYATTLLAATPMEAFGPNVTVVPAAGATWTLQLDGVCLGVVATGSGDSMYDGSGDDTFGARLQQIWNGTGSLCVFNTPTGDGISLRLEAAGPLPVSQQSFFPVGTEHHRTFRFDGTAAVELFDGTTLDLALLGEGVQIPSGFFQHSLYQTAPSPLSIADLTGFFMNGSLKLNL